MSLHIDEMELLLLFSITIFCANRISRLQLNRNLAFLEGYVRKREVIEVNRKLVVLAVALLALAMLATPVVMADKTDGQWVSVTQTFVSQIGPIIPSEAWRTDSGIFQLRGWQYRYTARLTVGNTIYPLYSVTTYDGAFNPNKGVVNLRYDVVWYWYTGPPAVSANGFAGNFELKLTNVITYPPPVYGPGGGGETIHCVLQGFGTFEGQTLMLSYDGPVHGGDLTGFLLVK